MPAMSLIDPALLQSLLGTAAGRFDVDAVDQIDSTNSELLRRAANGAPSGSVLVADWQSAGRGRRGRQWLSQRGDSLTFSLLWRFSASEISGLSLAVGVAVARALEGLGIREIGLKWPNDVLLPSGKLAGILVELQRDARGTLAIIGIGLNLTAPAADPAILTQPAAGLSSVLGERPEPHRVLASLLIALAEVFERFASTGFAAIHDDWQARHIWQFKPVRVLFDDGSERYGTCLGADDDGALLLETRDGVERFLSGDISLRLP